MIFWTLQFLGIWLLVGIFFGFSNTGHAFGYVRMNQKEFSVRIGPVTMIYFIGLVLMALS